MWYGLSLSPSSPKLLPNQFGISVPSSQLYLRFGSLSTRSKIYWLIGDRIWPDFKIIADLPLIFNLYSNWHLVVRSDPMPTQPRARRRQTLSWALFCLPFHSLILETPVLNVYSLSKSGLRMHYWISEALSFMGFEGLCRCRPPILPLLALSVMLVIVMLLV